MGHGISKIKQICCWKLIHYKRLIYIINPQVYKISPTEILDYGFSCRYKTYPQECSPYRSQRTWSCPGAKTEWQTPWKYKHGSQRYSGYSVHRKKDVHHDFYSVQADPLSTDAEVAYVYHQTSHYWFSRELSHSDHWCSLQENGHWSPRQIYSAILSNLRFEALWSYLI